MSYKIKGALFVMTLVLSVGVAFTDANAEVPNQVIEVLPNSTDLTDSVIKSTGITPNLVNVSSSVITQLDASVNTRANTAFGARAKRAEITVQNTGTTVLRVGYSATDISATSGWIMNPGDVWTFKVGRLVKLYGLSISAAGKAQVGGLAYRR